MCHHLMYKSHENLLFPGARQYTTYPERERLFLLFKWRLYSQQLTIITFPFEKYIYVYVQKAVITVKE